MSGRKAAASILVLTVTIGFGCLHGGCGRGDEGERREGRGGPRPPAPVEVAEIEHGPIVSRRTFSGTLEALSDFVVAPKVGGRVERLYVDIADPVTRGQVVAELDNDEYVQAVAAAEADLTVARANRVEAESALEISSRELERVRTLRKRGVASESQLDKARADQLAKRAAFEVAHAQVARQEAAVQTAKIRLGYTKVVADWHGGTDRRVVSRRYVNESDTVSANAPLLSIVSLDPIIGVIHVPEGDYARLTPGQPVHLTTDAFPGRRFEGRIERIAPIFEEATRQAEVRLRVANPEHHLKPGLFIRATVELETVPQATIVPVASLTVRDDRTGVFVVREDASAVRWCEVEVGVREGARVQVTGDGLEGRVVTLGQQLVSDGAPITIPGREGANGAGAAGADAG